MNTFVTYQRCWICRFWIKFGVLTHLLCARVTVLCDRSAVGITCDYSNLQGETGSVSVQYINHTTSGYSKCITRLPPLGIQPHDRPTAHLIRSCGNTLTPLYSHLSTPCFSLFLIFRPRILRPDQRLLFQCARTRPSRPCFCLSILLAMTTAAVAVTSIAVPAAVAPRPYFTVPAGALSQRKTPPCTSPLAKVDLDGHVNPITSIVKSRDSCSVGQNKLHDLLLRASVLMTSLHNHRRARSSNQNSSGIKLARSPLSTGYQFTVCRALLFISSYEARHGASVDALLEYTC